MDCVEKQTPDNTTEEQGQVSTQATEPKDSDQTETKRRTFLKRAGIATTALCAPSLTKPVAAKTKEPDKSLNKEIEQLQPEEKAALTTFLKGLWEVDRMLTPDLVKCWLSIIQAIDERDGKKAKEEKAKQQERQKRDSLTGQAKVDYVVEKLRTDNGIYRAGFQREFLELIRDDKPIPAGEHYTFRANLVNERFEGCSKTFRRKVINEYLTKVLPEMEAKQQEEDAEQEAYDNLINYLANNKTTEEVVALTEQIKQANAA